MNRILLNAFNQGGVADSIYSGVKNSLARMVGWNIHGIPGLLQVNQKMTKNSGTTIDELCKVAIDCSNGIRYWFSSTSGKIWQEKNGAYTLVYTTSPAAGAAATLGAQENQGYIYWATQSRLHRIPVASADGAIAWTTNAVPNWATFTNTDATYHPMCEVNLVLYIGDKNYVAQVDSGTFSANALDVESQYRVSALGKMGTDLIVGTIIASTVSRCEIFRWNTYGVSFINSDTIYEPGVNAFLETDNYVLINAGNAGNIYSYDGQFASFYKKIPGTYSPTKQAKINPKAVGLYNGTLPIFGVSNVQGNPCDEGIWSLGRHSNNYPTVLNLEFPTSNVDGSGYPIVSGVEIGAIIVSGQDVYISWAYNSTYGVDKLDYANKIAKPFLETRVMSPELGGFTTFNRFIATTEPLPSSTGLSFKLNKDGSGFGSVLADVLSDTQRNQTATEKERTDSRTLQLRLEATTSGNNAPAVQEIIVEVE
jgi:hypothetical protein